MTTTRTPNPLAAYLAWQDFGTTLSEDFVLWAMKTREA